MIETRKKQYLISLTGQGDTMAALVDKDVWDWVHDPTDKVKFPKWVAEALMKIENEWSTARGVDPLYNDVNEFVDKKTSEISSSGSSENDAALDVVNASSGTFWNMKEVFKYVKEHDIEIIDTYEGYIY